MNNFDLFDNSISLTTYDNINSPGYKHVSPEEFHNMVKRSKEWGEIIDLSDKNPAVKHHLDDLLAVVKLVKGED